MLVNIFGPPGAGKTTTIRMISKLIGNPARLLPKFAARYSHSPTVCVVDLEDERDLASRVASYRRVAQLVRERPGSVAFVAMADVSAREVYASAFANHLSVVLVPSTQGVYDARRARRDAAVPGKASQPRRDLKEYLDGLALTVAPNHTAIARGEEDLLPLVWAAEASVRGFSYTTHVVALRGNASNGVHAAATFMPNLAGVIEDMERSATAMAPLTPRVRHALRTRRATFRPVPPPRAPTAWVAGFDVRAEAERVNRYVWIGAHAADIASGYDALHGHRARIKAIMPCPLCGRTGCLC